MEILKQPDLLKISQIVLNLGPAWPADVCAAKTLTIIRISPAKGTKEKFKDFKKI